MSKRLQSRKVDFCHGLLGVAHAAANGFNYAGHLVANHLRHLHAMIHVAVKDVEIGTTNPAMRNSELDLAGPRIGWLTSARCDGSITCVEGCLHKRLF